MSESPHQESYLHAEMHDEPRCPVGRGVWKIEMYVFLRYTHRMPSHFGERTAFVAIPTDRVARRSSFVTLSGSRRPTEAMPGSTEAQSFVGRRFHVMHNSSSAKQGGG